MASAQSTTSLITSLTNARVAMLGYGAEARAQALRLREAGNEVAVAVRPGGMSWVRALNDGFRPCCAADAVKGADVVVMLVPDEEQPTLYGAQVAPNMPDGALLVFGHAGAVYTNALEPAPGLDVVLVTARVKEAAKDVASETEAADAIRCFVAVHVDSTGMAHARASAYARAAYGAVARTIEPTTFAEETALDISDQAVLSGGVAELVAAWEKVLATPSHEPDEARLAYYERLMRVVEKAGTLRIPSPPQSQVAVLDKNGVARAPRRGAA
jgi:ketol-acid reductoisomerase